MRILAGATTLARRVVDLVLLAVIVVVLLAVAIGRGAPLVGRQTIVIGGGSMEPTIPLGSAIVVRPVDEATLAVGDVVSLDISAEHATFTHRIIAIVDRADGRWIRTQGDANAAPDPTLVPASAVIGRVEVFVPLIGYLLTLLSLPVGVVFVLGLAATLLAIAWLLESLEPAKVVVTTVTRMAPPEDRADPGEVGIAAGQGEPIAARPARIALPGAGLTHAFAAPAGAAGPSIPTSVARPTVREQVERSRGVRRQRARWQTGRGARADGD